MRDHQPIIIEEFNGLWKRGIEDSCPIDHSPDCNNIQFGHSLIKTRKGLNTYLAISNPIRILNYNQQDNSGQSILILNDRGEIFHSPDENTVYGPVLTIREMKDFNVLSANGRAYITPFDTFLDPLTGKAVEKGLQNQFLYVYKGDGSPARKAGGEKPKNGGKLPFLVTNSSVDGKIAEGIHWFAVSFDDGILGTEIFPNIIAPGGKGAVLLNIPIGPPGTTKRTITATKAIKFKDYNPDQSFWLGEHYKLIDILDNTTTTKSIDFADEDLVTLYSPGSTAAPATGALLAQNSLYEGYNDFGFHLFGVVYETDTGFLTGIGPEFFAGLTTVDIKKRIDLFNIPVSPNSYVTKRHIVATKVIREYNGNQEGYQFFFVPDGTIDDNITTVKSISFYDADLLDDASYLIDNFTNIPAGVALASYHGRLVLGGEYDNISLLRVSFPGEPEAISQVDGLIVIPLDGNPVTKCQEFRDILYCFKSTRTFAISDNNDVPSSWSVISLDLGVGSSVHGVASVLASGGVSYDYLIVAGLSGVFLFNGLYQYPEISWKIVDYWNSLDKNDFRNLQIVNDTINKLLFLSLPNKNLLMGDYNNSLNYEGIRWCPATFDIEVTTVSIIERNRLLIGAVRGI